MAHTVDWDSWWMSEVYIVYMAWFSWVQFSVYLLPMMKLCTLNSIFPLYSTCFLKYQSHWNKSIFPNKCLKQNWLYLTFQVPWMSVSTPCSFLSQHHNLIHAVALPAKVPLPPFHFGELLIVQGLPQRNVTYISLTPDPKFLLLYKYAKHNSMSNTDQGMPSSLHTTWHKQGEK